LNMLLLGLTVPCLYADSLRAPPASPSCPRLPSLPPSPPSSLALILLHTPTTRHHGVSAAAPAGGVEPLAAAAAAASGLRGTPPQPWQPPPPPPPPAAAAPPPSVQPSPATTPAGATTPSSCSLCPPPRHEVLLRKGFDAGVGRRALVHPPRTRTGTRAGRAPARLLRHSTLAPTHPGGLARARTRVGGERALRLDISLCLPRSWLTLSNQITSACMSGGGGGGGLYSGDGDGAEASPTTALHTAHCSSSTVG
jgi:hypothetical protein